MPLTELNGAFILRPSSLNHPYFPLQRQFVNLFEYSLEQELRQNAPLAERMRPTTLDEFFGQAHILAKGRLLRRAIQADQLSSLIFYGPPGTGKTTLARIIANTTKAQFLSINAVLSGVKDIRECIATAKQFREDYQKRTILFVDEVHRFNKAQQDALLPHVENGVIILVGATTENPYFEVNKALVSRSRIFELKSLNEDDLEQVLDHVLQNEKRGYGKLKIELAPEAKKHLCQVANGDARALLNAFELAVTTSRPDEAGKIQIDLAIAEESIQKRAVLYDKDGDSHYDTISAFIKSIRGSDPDAALYWMAKMVYSGEDPKFIFRRMIISAGEDIGMADPHALQVVMSAAQAFDYVGMPEGRFHLAQACLYLATAPKSNTTFAFFDALTAISKEKEGEVPNHLKDSKRDKEGFGHGEGYLYPHAYKDHWAAQQYLPDSLQGKLFYQPSEQGYEAKIKDQVTRRREAQLAVMLESNNLDSQSAEFHWQDRTMGSTGELLEKVRDRLFSLLPYQRNSLTLNLNAGSGLLLGEILRKAPDGSHYAQVFTEAEESILRNQYQGSELFSQPIIHRIPTLNASLNLKAYEQEDIQFEIIFGMNLTSKIGEKGEVWQQLHSLLQEAGSLVLCENIPVKGQRLSAFLEEERLGSELFQKLQDAESKIYEDSENPLVNWDETDLSEQLSRNGFQIKQLETPVFHTETLISYHKLAQWFSEEIAPKPSYAQHLLESLSAAEVQKIKQQLTTQLVGKAIQWKTTWVLLLASPVVDLTA